MVSKTFRGPNVAARRLWPAFCLGACLAATASAAADRQSWVFTLECSTRDAKVNALIEEHGAAQLLPSETLGKAGLTMLEARTACYDGRIADALALYDSVLAIGPVASLRPK